MKKQLVSEWMDKAEEDYRTAEQLAKISLSDFATTICFHAQQCAEKYLKALIVGHNIEPPWIHTLETLLELVVAKIPMLEKQRLILAKLTPYATEYRYPGKIANEEEAKACIDNIRSFRKTMRDLLETQL
ncbi:MAG: HEPN domain-containing protein [Candidatus Ranarchaeia archaeon]